MLEQRKRYHWDKRKKAYVQLQPGEDLDVAGRRGKSESGAKQHAGKKKEKGSTGSFQRWAKANRVKLPAAGEYEGAAGFADNKHLKDRSVKLNEWSQSEAADWMFLPCIAFVWQASICCSSTERTWQL